MVRLLPLRWLLLPPCHSAISRSPPEGRGDIWPPASPPQLALTLVRVSARARPEFSHTQISFWHARAARVLTRPLPSSLCLPGDSQPSGHRTLVADGARQGARSAGRGIFGTQQNPTPVQVAPCMAEELQGSSLQVFWVAPQGEHVCVSHCWMALQQRWRSLLLWRCSLSAQCMRFSVARLCPHTGRAAQAAAVFSGAVPGC